MANLNNYEQLQGYLGVVADQAPVGPACVADHYASDTADAVMDAVMDAVADALAQRCVTHWVPGIHSVLSLISFGHIYLF